METRRNRPPPTQPIPLQNSDEPFRTDRNSRTSKFNSESSTPRRMFSKAVKGHLVPPVNFPVSILQTYETHFPVDKVVLCLSGAYNAPKATILDLSKRPSTIPPIVPLNHNPRNNYNNNNSNNLISNNNNYYYYYYNANKITNYNANNNSNNSINNSINNNVNHSNNIAINNNAFTNNHTYHSDSDTTVMISESKGQQDLKTRRVVVLSAALIHKASPVLIVKIQIHLRLSKTFEYFTDNIAFDPGILLYRFNSSIKN